MHKISAAGVLLDFTKYGMFPLSLTMIIIITTIHMMIIIICWLDNRGSFAA